LHSQHHSLRQRGTLSFCVSFFRPQGEKTTHQELNIIGRCPRSSASNFGDCERFSAKRSWQSSQDGVLSLWR